MPDPEFRLYNTLTRKIEPFRPEDGKTVRMYTCGPTVYKPAHLGNFRTFLFEDLLRRVLALRGWKLFQVMNLTDVDDKIIKNASEQGKSIDEVTAPVTETFHKDRAFLRIQDAELYPKATDHIPEMIALIGTLIAMLRGGKADIALELEPNVSQAVSEGARVLYAMPQQYEANWTGDYPV